MKSKPVPKFPKFSPAETAITRTYGNLFTLLLNEYGENCMVQHNPTDLLFTIETLEDEIEDFKKDLVTLTDFVTAKKKA